MPAIPTGKPWYYYLSHLFILAGLVILGSSVFSVLGVMLCKLLYPGIDVETVLKEIGDAEHPAVGFILLVASSLGSFFVPALLYPALARHPLRGFHPLHAPSSVLLVLLAVVLSLLSLNPSALALEITDKVNLNKLGDFGTWLSEQQDSYLNTISRIAMEDGPAGLIGALVVLVLIPAIGEELLFRGVLQRVLQSWIGRHIGIVVAAIIFSAVHAEFSGFLARIVLGIFLGYVFLWTNNLWYPIIIHLVNNALVVIVARSMPTAEPNLNEIGMPGTAMAIAGTIAFIGFLYFFFRLSQRHREDQDGKALGESLHYEPTTDG